MHLGQARISRSSLLSIKGSLILNSTYSTIREGKSSLKEGKKEKKEIDTFRIGILFYAIECGFTCGYTHSALSGQDFEKGKEVMSGHVLIHQGERDVRD